jgi:AraC-like DNA-binding protein
MVVERVGSNSISYLSKAFKKEYGNTQLHIKKNGGEIQIRYISFIPFKFFI